MRSKGPSGGPSRMTPDGRAWLATELDRAPAAHGWFEDLRWTLARVGTVIARRFHVRVSTAQTRRILHQMGFTVQVPMRRAAERDQDAVATWIRETWPRVERR
ncbi:winged helix-turn-helix domain-containing protein [Streptomyces sioyaensis]